MLQVRSGGGLVVGLAALGAGLVLLVAAAAWPAAGPPRVALVVGNSAYQHVAKLANPANDAADVAARLRSLGFDVELANDLDRKQLSRAVRRLAQRAEDAEAEAAVFFYAGHGVQLERTSYLVPTDAEIVAKSDVAFEMDRLTTLLAPLESDRRATIVLLDACRNDPFTTAGEGDGRSLEAGTGLGQPSAGRGTLIGYATGDGDVAADGATRNSPFTASLLRHLETPGLDVRELLRRVRADLAKGGSRQLSETSDRLAGEFHFRPPAPEPKAVAAAPPPSPAEQQRQASLADLPDFVLWKAIEGSSQPADYEFFLKQHPASGLRGLAEDRLRRLTANLGMSVEVVPGKQPAPAPVPPPAAEATGPAGRVAARPTTPSVAGAVPSAGAPATTTPPTAPGVPAKRPDAAVAAAAGAKPPAPAPNATVGGRPPSPAQQAEQKLAALPPPPAPPRPPEPKAAAPTRALPPSLPPNGEAVRVGAKPGVLRSGPGRGYEQLTPPVAGGAVLTAGRRQRGWVEVWGADGRYGWLGEGAIEKARRPRAPGEVFRDCPDAAACPELVAIAPGAFVMGSPDDEAGREDDEGPARELTLAKPLAVGRFEVTFAEWDACVAAGGCGGRRPDDRGWGRGRRPVIDVSFDDAQAYLAWLSGKTGRSYRLLGEAEWEYVARAGDRGPNPWNDRDAKACGFASLHDEVGRERNGSDWAAAGCSDGHAQTAPVGTFAANAWGLHDMLGNVAEWTADCWSDDLAGHPADGTATGFGDCSGRALRGGSWQEYLDGMRYAARSPAPRGARTGYDGFRVARDLDEGLAGSPPAAVAEGG